MGESFQGSSVSSMSLQKMMDHLFNPEDPGRAMPLCLWGHHGIGKTEMVKGYAKSKGWQFKYLAPAQLEEMGREKALVFLKEKILEEINKANALKRKN